MLNYSVPPLQFLIGSFDASQYLDSVSLSVPMHEPGQALLWSGRFKVSNNLKARANGLTDADFSELASPQRWRPYQVQVRLNIRGNLSPVFRIENYRYNAQNLTGEGTLTQIPTAVAGDRPGVAIETTVSGSIGSVMVKLLDATFLGATVHPSYGLDADGGLLDVPLTTRNPWADVVRLASLNWNWLTVDRAESIVSVAGAGGAMVFSRSLEQVELVPDLAAIFQAANEIIVTGARQVENKSKVEDKSKVVTVPRPKFKKTTEYRPAGTVFPSLGTSTTPVLFEEKTIIYQYWDDDSWSDYLPLFSNPLVAFLYDIQAQTQTGINPYKRPVDINVPLQTITMKRQPLGYLFPALGTNPALSEAEVLVESNLRKLTLKPLGVLFPAAGNDATLVVEKREDLTSVLVPPGVQLTPVKKDKDGKGQEYEARPALEPAQVKATRPLVTEVLKGVCRLSPLNWVPVLVKPLVVDFGFLPDKERAEFLANKIAVREQQRRDQVLVDMPIADEWLAAGWPILGQCQIGGNTYLMDGCALSISDGEAKFGFTGALVSLGAVVDVGGIPTLVQQSQYQVTIELESSIVFEATISSAAAAALEPSIVFEMVLQSGVRADIEPSIVFDASISSAGGTMLAPEMVFESIVSTGAGIALDAGIIFEAIVTTGTLQTLNITVSTASQLEGSPVLQTLNITVSTASQLEGN
jgi:hypothetical protein